MPQLSFPQSSVSVPSAGGAEKRDFSGFSDLASGLFNLGQAQQQQQGALARQQRVASGYDLYRQFATDVTRNLAELDNTVADLSEREKQGNELFIRLNDEYSQIAAERGFSDEFLKHAVPYTITRQDKYIGDTHSQLAAHSESIVKAEKNLMIGDITNDSLGFVTDLTDHTKIDFDDNTKEIMGTSLSAYQDLVASIPGRSLAQKNADMMAAGEELMMSVGRKTALVDPKTFLDSDPTKQLTIDIPLFDMDGGFRAYKATYTQTQVDQLRDAAYSELTKQHTQAGYIKATHDEAVKTYSNQIKAATMAALKDNLPPQEVYDTLLDASPRMDPGILAETTASVTAYYNARKGSPHEEPNPSVHGMVTRIRAGGTTGPDAVTEHDINYEGAMNNWTQHEWGVVRQEFDTKSQKESTEIEKFTATQMKFVRNRFTSIVNGANPLQKILGTPASSIDRLANEVEAIIASDIQAIKDKDPSGLTTEKIMEIVYSAQTIALDGLFADEAERMTPEHNQAFAKLIQSGIAKGKPAEMDTRTWIVQNAMKDPSLRAKSFDLLFMAEMYNANVKPDAANTLDAQRAPQTLFPEHEPIKRWQEQGTEASKKIAEVAVERQARQRKFDADMQRIRESAKGEK